VARDECRGAIHCCSLPLDTRHSVLGNLKPGKLVSTHRLDPQFLCKTRELSYRLHAELLHDAGSVGFIVRSAAPRSKAICLFSLPLTT
jgi:hypothetical protein